MWPSPGKRPPQNVDRAVLVTVHDEATGLTAIRPLVERHLLLAATTAARLARIAFIDLDQCFPSQLTLVGEHLDEAIQPPLVEDAAMQGFLMLGMCFCDHLPLLKLTDHHSAFNQLVSDEM